MSAIRRWSGWAWGAIAAATVFIALTCWWLTQDRSIPVFDAGEDLRVALQFHGMLASGNLLGPFEYSFYYPPFVHTVGALAAFVGGVNVASPIVGENLVFVSLLALGCYQTARLLFGAPAGLLAVVFVLGGPMLIAQFHVLMLDAPEAAVVAVSVWLILASERLRRTRTAALVGVALGVGVLVKTQFPTYVVGVLAAALVRGGWRQWRGLVALGACALLVGGTWYLDHFSQLSLFTKLAGPEGTVAVNHPATFSLDNLTYYFWSILDYQLLAPLFALATGGLVWTVVSIVKRRGPARGARIELLAGVLVAWIGLSLTPHHDPRYALSLMPYLAVLGAGWIVELQRLPRFATAAVLVLAVCANTLSTTFGIGHDVEVKLAGKPPPGSETKGTIKLYSPDGYLVAGPRRDGDVLALLQALHRGGVSTLGLSVEEGVDPQFSFEGLEALALIAGLRWSLSYRPQTVAAGAYASLVHRPLTAHGPSPCTTLSDGDGVYAIRYDEAAKALELYCPYRQPAFYARVSTGGGAG